MRTIIEIIHLGRKASEREINACIRQWLPVVILFVSVATTVMRSELWAQTSTNPAIENGNTDNGLEPVRVINEQQFIIDVPPGTNNVQPSISLSYKRQNKWGITGYGWTIEGIDSVRRSRRSGVPRYDNYDSFEWRGKAMLLGDDGTFHCEQEPTYGIENHGGFASESHWQIMDSKGVRFRYGYNPDSRIEAVHHNGNVGCWALDQVQYSHGTTWTISYNEDTEHGDFYPEAITYTIDSSEGNYANSTGTIHFLWERRPDIRETYSSGAKVVIDQRLSAIEIKVDNNLVRQYNLTYAPGSGGKSLLTEIEEKNDHGKSNSRSTRFRYHTAKLGFNRPKKIISEQKNSSEESDSNLQIQIIDMNGDSLPDEVFQSDNRTYRVRLNKGSILDVGQNWFSEEYQIPQSIESGNVFRALMDINNDDLPDDIFRNKSGNYRVHLNTGNRFGKSLDWGSGFDQYIHTFWEGSQIKGLIDMNGDGLPDDVYRKLSGNYNVRLNKGNRFSPVMDWGTGQYEYLRASTDGAQIKDLIDMNGDGFPDDVYRKLSGNYKVRLNTGSGFSEIQDWGTGQGTFIRLTSDGKQSKDLIDMNGDNLPDDVYRSASGNYSVRLNTGSGFGPQQDWGSGQREYIRIDIGKMVMKDLIDISGDGLPDDVVRDVNGNYRIRKNQAQHCDLMAEMF